MCGQHNVRASAEDNTGQNTDKGHTPSPNTEIKIPEPAGLEGRDSTDHATVTDIIVDYKFIFTRSVNFMRNLILGFHRLLSYFKHSRKHTKLYKLRINRRWM